MRGVVTGDYNDGPRVKAHPVLIFVPALLCSVLLHALAVSFLPELPIGRTPDFKMDKEYVDFALGDVRPEPPTAFVDRPEQDRTPQMPNTENAMQQASSSFQEVLEPWLTKRESQQLSKLAESADAVSPDEALPDLAPLQARQEIMAVDRELFDREEALLPRSYTPEIPRSDIALDITLPVENLPDQLTALAAPADLGLPAPAPLGAPDVPLLASLPTTGVLDSGQAGGPSLVEQEPSAVIDQALDPLTEFIPVENLVDIRTEVFFSPDEPGTRYFRIHILPRAQSLINPAPRRLMFIQDCSESMSNWKLRRCREGWLKVLNELREDDQFNIMSFRDEVTLCFEDFVPATRQTLAQARLYVSEMRSRGKTDVHGSLEYLSTILPRPHTATLAILVTDGRPTMGLVDSTDIIESFSRSNDGRVSLFTVGSGREANRYLLDLMAYRNRGGTLLVPKNDDLPETMESMNRQVYHPILLNPEFRFIGAEELEVYPRKLTHLYAGRPLIMTGKVSAGAPEIAFQLVGQSGQGDHDMVFRINWNVEERSSDDLRFAWAWQKMYALIGEVTATGSETARAALRTHARRTGLTPPYAIDADDPITR